MALAVSLGGMLLAYQALDKLSMGLGHLADVGITWSQIAPLFQAASPSEAAPPPTVTTELQRAPISSGEVVLEARDLVFRYAGRREPILHRCSLSIQNGERILLQGASGGGKSTLSAILSGLRQPESGLLMLHGLDRATLGTDAWRRRIVSAPQFHDNHVLSGTLAFNLLMGGNWPPRQKELQAAEALCRDLGLGELIDRMPAGLFQMAGETGWQLSHGEQSRLFIARALLQRAELVILDESFGALDPETLQRALRCVDERAKTLFVIAHP